MARKWQLQEAKNRFSRVVEEALLHGPQTVTRHGEETVVVLSIKDYRKLLREPTDSFADFMLRSPLRGSGLRAVRDKRPPRKVSL